MNLKKITHHLNWNGPLVDGPVEMVFDVEFVENDDRLRQSLPHCPGEGRHMSMSTASMPLIPIRDQIGIF